MGRLLNRIGLTTWKRRIIALLIVLPLLGFGSVELTSQSWFCNSCHIMNPYYDSWNRGAHKDVECVKCHISPGVDNFMAAKFNGLGQVVDDVLHRTSMKPSASVNDLACTRSGCHDIARVKESSKTNGKFLFKHDKHVDLEYGGIKLACSSCHSHVKGDQHFEVDTNVCVTCHLVRGGPDTESAGTGLIQLAVREGRIGEPKPASATKDGKAPPATCKTCHNPPTETIERGGIKINHAEYLAYGAACESCHRGNTMVPVPIENGQCYECHTFGLEKKGDVADMHKEHLSGRHKIECFSCHGTVHHGPTAQTAKLAQFDCRQCHVDQHGVQRRAYLNGDAHTVDAHSGTPGAAGGTTPMSPMFLAHVDCTGCHISRRPVSVKPDSGATVAAATPEACDACHKPGFGAQLVPQWQKSTHALYDQAMKDLQLAQGTVAGDDGKAALAEVRKLLDTVKVDGSWGVHNPKYTQQLLEQARAKLASAKGAAPAATPAKEGTP